jgi:hypothetical protein
MDSRGHEPRELVPAPEGEMTRDMWLGATASGDGAVMPEMTINWAFIEDLEKPLYPVVREAKFICKACCSEVRITRCDNGCCVATYCPKHPSILIKDGKVVGTSA